MKPIWKNNRLTVELHLPERSALRKARQIGESLVAMNQDIGKPLVDAVNAILEKPTAEESEDAKD